MDQRLQFLSSYQKEEMSVADLCREYGISRATGYRWINRYHETKSRLVWSHPDLVRLFKALFRIR